MNKNIMNKKVSKAIDSDAKSNKEERIISVLHSDI